MRPGAFVLCVLLLFVGRCLGRVFSYFGLSFGVDAVFNSSVFDWCCFFGGFGEVYFKSVVFGLVVYLTLGTEKLFLSFERV